MADTARKIKTIDELAALLEDARAAGKAAAHCHGVFDPLHIGHIKHFAAAAKLADLLVVTVTPDRFVNKGPHRPAFGERLRAEAIAALECVDYVAVNEWPSAVETIGKLRPAFFVKGEVKEKGPRDHSDAILREEAAVKAAGGRIHFTEEDTFSASALVNRHTDVFSSDVRDYLAAFRGHYPEEAVLDYVRGMANLKVLTVGETIIDEYMFCYVMNKANKDPILAAKFLYGEKYLGGIQAINNHLAGFCGGVSCLTALGDREVQEEFIREQLDARVKLCHFPKTGSPTIVKRRYIEEYMSVKLLEIDDMNDDPLLPEDEDRCCEMVAELAPAHDVVVVADYGHGLLTDRVVSVLCEKARFLAITVQVNPGNYGFNLVSRYPRADLVVIDEPEARLEMKKKQADIESIAKSLYAQMRCKNLLITRGQNGTLGYDGRRGFTVTPVFSTRLVDRIGAGDACLAMTGPCAALGAPTEVLGFLGNVAGAAACGIMGNKSYIDPVSYLRGITSLLK